MELRDVNREGTVDINDVKSKKTCRENGWLILFHRSRTLTAILTGNGRKDQFCRKNRLEDTLKKMRRTHRK